MYVVLRNGKRLKVDESNLDEEDTWLINQPVALIDNDTVLKEVWYCSFQKQNASINKCSTVPKADMYEFVGECVYDHEPTKDELIAAMTAIGLTRYDLVTVSKSYEMDFA